MLNGKYSTASVFARHERDWLKAIRGARRDDGGGGGGGAGRDLEGREGGTGWVGLGLYSSTTYNLPHCLHTHPSHTHTNQAAPRHVPACLLATTLLGCSNMGTTNLSFPVLTSVT